MGQIFLRAGVFKGSVCIHVHCFYLVVRFAFLTEIYLLLHLLFIIRRILHQPRNICSFIR